VASTKYDPTIKVKAPIEASTAWGREVDSVNMGKLSVSMGA
jgi:hypothetical protein